MDAILVLVYLILVFIVTNIMIRKCGCVVGLLKAIVILVGLFFGLVLVVGLGKSIIESRVKYQCQLTPVSKAVRIMSDIPVPLDVDDRFTIDGCYRAKVRDNK